MGEGPEQQRASEVLAAARALHRSASAVLADHRSAVDDVRAALAPLQDELVSAELRRIPLERLREVTEGRLRLNALRDAGHGTVDDVLTAGRHGVKQAPGVGAHTADQAVAAARRLAEAVRETVSVRFDVDRREERAGRLLAALHRLVDAGPEAREAVEGARRTAARLRPLLDEAAPAGRRVRRLLLGPRRRARVRAATAELTTALAEADRAALPAAFAQTSADLLRPTASPLAAWVDFEARSAEYHTLLDEIAGAAPEEAAAEGHLPQELVARVRAQPLHTTHLRLALRGYQEFGARFALVQRRVIIGDEMGLGKTVEAIAVLAHLAAQGRARFLVACPASVLVGWVREVRTRSTLRAVPLHGPGRHDAFAEWQESGGVAVTTFDGLRALDAGVADALVVDEAHYVKNPQAQRSQAVAEWASAAGWVLFLTGTPMENRVAEFRNLLAQLGSPRVPAPTAGDGLAGSRRFRRAVAGAYLRRNQEDVLGELPPLVHTDEWEEPAPDEYEVYRAAVEEGNFMAMRRAAYAAPDSAKLRRLVELVAEAEQNGRRAVVFSYFHEVLSRVREALEREGSEVFGPLTGAVPPAARQRLVDDFSATDGPAVLLAQIQAGGVGLNLQAASVVLLCEPQLKPTAEEQAVARARRMGQTRPVHVHRLLATSGVDLRIVELLRRKSRLFDAYARRSDLADAAPDAVDVSDAETARRIVEDEQTRLARESDGAAEADDAAVWRGE